MKRTVKLLSAVMLGLVLGSTAVAGVAAASDGITPTQECNIDHPHCND